MDKTDTCIMMLIFILSLVVFYYLDFHYDEYFYGNSITFLSIIIGFTMTSLSILYNTDCIKKFSKLKDAERKNYTVLHRLGAYYHLQLNFSMFLVLFYLFEHLLIDKFELLEVFSILNFPLLLCNCFLTVILIKFFIKLFTHPNFGKE